MTSNSSLKKLSNAEIESLLSKDRNKDKSLLSAELNSSYDLDLACQVLELINTLKIKITEDFVTIDNIKEKLTDITTMEFVITELNNISVDLNIANTKVEFLLKKLSPNV